VNPTPDNSNPVRATWIIIIKNVKIIVT